MLASWQHGQIIRAPEPGAVEHRRLFVDDFLIESSRNLVRQWHKATVQSVGVVVPDQPWERGGERGIANRLTARPFGGGALYDPRAQMVKLWYRCTCSPPACPKPPAFPYLSTPTCPTIQVPSVRMHVMLRALSIDAAGAA